ncbi:alpha/beta hydrolase [Maricurvus nonylphenolicus]|uniref:alpha/beta hydrolase n=1 Tax=Maricurvus nonylphenolicus TaxID=1008307 RepID=UPI0036F1F1CD
MALEVLESGGETADPNKPPLLFIHGVLHGAWCWELFLDYFSREGFACYALSLRGHGGSPIAGPLSKVGIKDYVDDVRTTVSDIENRHGPSPVLIGHSMGGFIVQKYLERFWAPRTVLLASAPPRGVFKTMLRMFLRSPIMSLKVLGLRDMRYMISDNQLTRAFAFSEEMPEEDVTRYRLLMGEESFKAFLDMLLHLPKTKLIVSDMMVVGSDSDSVFSMEQVRQTAKAYNAELQLFQGMGHDMMLEPRWKSVAEAIHQWLSR